MDFKVIIFIAVVLLLGIVLFAILTLKQKSTILDKEKYRSLWLEIENNLDTTTDNQHSFQMTVLSADKLLGQALEELGVPGGTMGERMKAFGKGFSNQDQVWQAHKIRNKIAHESNVKLTLKQVHAVLKCFKQALKDVGAI